MDQRTRRSPARFLAPLALIAVVVVLAAIVSGSDKAGNGSPASDVGTTQATKSAHTTAAKTGKTPATSAHGPRSYIVKLGDSLGSISNKTGVSLERIQELNPNVDSTLLTVGQKIRLR